MGVGGDVTLWTWVGQHRWLVTGMGVVTALVLAAAGVWLFVVRSPSTPLGLRQALRLYRNAQHGHQPAGAESAKAGAMPPLGVYRYRTSGSERLSFGNITRAFPSLTDMIVTGSVCESIAWEPLRQHVEQTVVCPARDGGLSMVSTSGEEEIAGITTHDSLACDRSSYLVPPDPRAGDRWSGTCHGGGEQVAVTGRLLGTVPVSVGGRTVRALHTRVTLDYHGAQVGTSPTDYWVSSTDRVILRQTETVAVSQKAGPLGAVDYDEAMRVSLLSLTPLR